MEARQNNFMQYFDANVNNFEVCDLYLWSAEAARYDVIYNHVMADGAFTLMHNEQIVYIKTEARWGKSATEIQKALKEVGSESPLAYSSFFFFFFFVVPKTEGTTTGNTLRQFGGLKYAINGGLIDQLICIHSAVMLTN